MFVMYTNNVEEVINIWEPTRQNADIDLPSQKQSFINVEMKQKALKYLRLPKIVNSSYLQIKNK